MLKGHRFNHATRRRLLVYCVVADECGALGPTKRSQVIERAHVEGVTDVFREERVSLVDAAAGEDLLNVQEQLFVQADDLGLLEEILSVLNRTALEIKACLLDKFDEAPLSSWIHRCSVQRHANIKNRLIRLVQLILLFFNDYRALLTEFYWRFFLILIDHVMPRHCAHEIDFFHIVRDIRLHHVRHD